MVLDPIPQSLSVHFFGSRPQRPTSLLYPLPVLQRICTFAYQDVLVSLWCEWLGCNESAVDVPFGQFFILFAYLPMWWLRLVGSIKLQVSFAKEPWKKRWDSAKKTYDLIDPTNRSHPISWYIFVLLSRQQLGCNEPRVYRKGLPTFARRNKACVFVLL